MSKNFTLCLAALLSAALFSSCEKLSGGNTPTPEPAKVETFLRFYVTEDQDNLTDIKFLGQYNGSTEFVELLKVKKVAYVDKYDKEVKAALELIPSDAKMIVYQTSLFLDKGTHSFQMNFTRNGVVSTKEEIDLLVAINRIENDYLYASTCCNVSGGVKVSELPSYLDNHINGKHIYTFEKK